KPEVHQRLSAEVGRTGIETHFSEECRTAEGQRRGRSVPRVPLERVLKIVADLEAQPFANRDLLGGREREGNHALRVDDVPPIRPHAVRGDVSETLIAKLGVGTAI